MKFAYSVNIAPAPETGEPIAILRPEVHLRIHGPSGSENHFALVDTGADNTIVPFSVARQLGIETANCHGPEARAFGGQRIALTFADVDLELIGESTSIRWQARVFFADSGETSEGIIILGHQGFLDFFTAIFDGEDCTVDMEPNNMLPVIR